jgi:two-component system response regulator NreC
MRVILGDGHRFYFDGMKALLEQHGVRVVGEGTDGRSVLELVKRHEPDIAVLDVGLPGLNGISTAREIVQSGVRTKPVMLTTHRELASVVDALRAGACGYVLKSRPVAELVHCLHVVESGQVYLSPNIDPRIMEAVAADEPLTGSQLTGRERHVLQLIAEGKTTKEIATILGVAIRTADSHRRRLMQTLNIHDVAGLTRHAIRKGLVQL